MPVKAPPPVAAPVFTWTGCYIGVHGGGAWSKHRRYDEFGVEHLGGEHEPDGFFVGGQLGCNLQTGQWVFGIEGQAAWADMKGESSLFAHPFFGFDTRVHTEANIIGSIAGRVGWAFDRVLIYGKGGAAFINEGHFVTVTGFGTVAETDRDLRWGWMAGGGVEYAFTLNWSGKIEYNYMNFGREDRSGCLVADPAVCATFEVKHHVHLVKIGLNYRFGGETPAGVVARY